MTFAEADRRYADLRQQFTAGTLTVEQFDDGLHDLMVQDEIGRWWAKSRETGEWHYYDAVTDSWVPAIPPADKAASPPARPAEPQPKQQKHAKPDKHEQQAAKAQPARSQQDETALPAQPAAYPPYDPAAQTPGTEVGGLPKWAAVAPGAEPLANPGPAQLEALPGAPADALVPPVPAPGTSNRLRDFGPVPELGGALKLLLYLVSLVLPIAGVLLFFVYRNKPAQADRAAARAFLILGVLSLVFTCLCSGTFWLFEGVMLGTTPT